MQSRISYIYALSHTLSGTASPVLATPVQYSINLCGSHHELYKAIIYVMLCNSIIPLINIGHTCPHLLSHTESENYAYLVLFK